LLDDLRMSATALAAAKVRLSLYDVVVLEQCVVSPAIPKN
jgi:hypothetical protein